MPEIKLIKGKRIYPVPSRGGGILNIVIADDFSKGSKLMKKLKREVFR